MWPALNEIDLALKRLPEWMKDEDRSGDAVWSFKTVGKSSSNGSGGEKRLTFSVAKVKKQPKGVCLVSLISPTDGRAPS